MIFIIVNPWTIGLVAAAVTSTAAAAGAATAKGINNKLNRKEAELEEAKKATVAARKRAESATDELGKAEKKKLKDEIQKAREQKIKAEKEAFKQEEAERRVRIETEMLKVCDFIEQSKVPEDRIEKFLVCAKAQLAMAHVDGQALGVERESIDGAIAEMKKDAPDITEKLEALSKSPPSKEEALEAIQSRVKAGDDPKNYLDALLGAMYARTQYSSLKGCAS